MSISLVFYPSYFTAVYPCMMLRVWYADEGSGCLMGDEELFAGFRVKFFSCAILFDNLRPFARSQFGSQYHRGMGSSRPWIIREYDLTTEIAIRPLIQNFTCKMGSSIFSAMSWIKFESTTRASLPRMLSTERTNIEKCFRCLWQCLPCVSYFFFSQLARSLFIGSNL